MLATGGAGAELVCMSSPQTAPRPSALVRVAVALAALLCTLVFAQGAEAKAVKGSAHGRQVQVADRTGKKSDKQRRTTRTSRRKPSKGKP